MAHFDLRVVVGGFCRFGPENLVGSCFPLRGILFVCLLAFSFIIHPPPLPPPLQIPLIFLLPSFNPSFNPSSSPPALPRKHSTRPASSPCSVILFRYLVCGFFSMAIVAEPRFHVLAVDDSITDRKLIERLLKTSSFQVTTVDSGSKALEFLGLVEEEQQQQQTSSTSVFSYHQEIDVNLVITDYCMPGMTGYDLLKKIKESSSLKDIPVVIMSSENAPSRISRCLEEGADEFLLKPVKLSDMKKLRPHILKGKCKDQQHQKITCNIDITATASPGSGGSGSGKRKAMDDETLAPPRTRTRFNNETMSVI